MWFEGLKSGRRLLLLILSQLIVLPTESANISCFCNSPSCPQAVCDSSQRCYSRLQITASADANVSTSVMYGCLDEFNSSDLCLNSSVMMCCDTQLCNMPNKLRKVIKVHERTSPTQITHSQMVGKIVKCKCASSSPAMRVASVVAPCVLILTVILLSLATCRKMSRYQKNKNTTIERSIKNRPFPFIPLGCSTDSDIPESLSEASTSTRSGSYPRLIFNPHSV